MTPAEYIERQLSNARISLSKAESRNDRHAQLRLRHRIDLLERLKTEAAENSELKQALTDLVQMKVDDCDLCKHNFPRDTCENYDYDCQLCNAIGCTCAACRNNDKFEWRGVIGEPQNPQKTEALQGAMDRLGMFGQLFVDYAGCPRGPMGRMAGASLIDEAMSMDVLVDVDGGRWIPVQADVLRELCEQSKSRWISVNERLPNGWIMVDETTNYREPEEYIVFIDGAALPTTAYCIDGKFVPLCTVEGCGIPKCIGYADKVTYWMPMPEPPKEG